METQFAMVNISEEHDLTSETTSTSEYPTSSSSLPSSSSPSYSSASTSSLSSVYYSPRIQSMIENRSRFSSETELDIEYSRDHWSELMDSDIENSSEHWSELTDSDTDSAATRLANRAHFEKLKDHPEWGGFFMDLKVELGAKINEGGQAEIYDAKVEFEDGRKSAGYGYHVVKVMKGDCRLERFQRQWPVGMLCNASKDRVKGPLQWIQGGTLVNDRFAFVMVRQWGDLRKLIDMKMRLNNNRGPPFASFEFVRKIMLCIAKDMDALHTKYKIVHRDLKASNVLLWSFSEQLPDTNPHVKANVVDYECSVGVVGTGFWRAPEILEQVKKGIPSSKLMFTFKSDVYSYGMLCYELLTGRTPFEGHLAQDYDVVLSGTRPVLPKVPSESRLLVECVEMCWSEMPWERPSFSEIVEILETSASSSSSSSSVYLSPRIQSMIQNRARFSRETGSSSAEKMRKWGDLQKLIDMKMLLNNNRGPPFESSKFVRKVMLYIARDMNVVHTKYKIVHRDLKASNVLLWSFGEELPDVNPHVKANVVNYNCSTGVTGTEIWRAPEILEQLKKGTPSSEIVYTFESDVYSYGMVCYVLLTGRVPFEGHSSRNYDAGLSGNRPEFPDLPRESRLLVDCVESCWMEMPWERPSFSEIVERLEASVSWPRSDRDYGNRRVSRGLWKWGNLWKFTDLRPLPIYVHQGPLYFGFLRMVMWCIARDLDALYTKYKIVHRDLKASNVLLWSSDRDWRSIQKANVVDNEFWVGVVGTGFSSAPNNVESLKKWNGNMKDGVYSYGLVCYELLTGRISLEGHSSLDYDDILPGTMGHGLDSQQVQQGIRRLVECVEMCLREDEQARPTFSEVLNIVNSIDCKKKKERRSQRRLA